MKKINIILIGVTLFFMQMTAFAADKVEVNISGGYPPFYIVDKVTSNCNPSGFCIDIINEVAKMIDIYIVYNSYPWNRCLKNMEYGNGDAMLPLYKTADREKYMFYDENNILASRINNSGIDIFTDHVF